MQVVYTGYTCIYMYTMYILTWFVNNFYLEHIRPVKVIWGYEWRKSEYKNEYSVSVTLLPILSLLNPL